MPNGFDDECGSIASSVASLEPSQTFSRQPMNGTAAPVTWNDENVEVPVVGRFGLVLYHGDVYLVQFSEVDQADKTAEVLFFSSWGRGSYTRFKPEFPRATCWVPFGTILSHVETPLPMSRGRLKLRTMDNLMFWQLRYVHKPDA